MCNGFNCKDRKNRCKLHVVYVEDDPIEVNCATREEHDCDNDQKYAGNHRSYLSCVLK